MKTLMPIMEAIDGSFDEMLYPEKHNEKISGDAIANLMSAIRETNGEHIHDIRTHYKEHHDDMKENYEKRLSDKRELIEMQNLHIEKLEEISKSKTKIIFILTAIFVTAFLVLLVLEMLHPEHGWIRF